MQSHQSREFKPELSPFELIYNAAKEKNKHDLLHLLSIVDIDVYHGGYGGTPMTKLATEDDNDSIDFLMTHHASPRWAAFGLAYGGHSKEAYAFLDKIKRESPSDVNTLFKYMAAGFARCGNIKDAYAVLDRVKSQYPAHSATTLEFMGYGLALGGHIKEVYTFLNKVKGDHPLHLASIVNEIAEGFAQKGLLDEAYIFLLKIRSEYPTFNNSIINAIAYGLAKGGQINEAYEWLNTIKSEHFTLISSVLAKMVKGFAQGGFIKEAYALLDKVKKENTAPIAPLLESMAYGLSDGRHKKESYLFLDIVKNEYPAHTVNVIKTIASTEKVTHRCINQAVVLKTLTLMDDPHARSELARELRIHVNAYNTLALVPKADIFNRHMRSRDLTYDQLIGLTNPDMRLFLLLGFSLIRQKHLPDDLFLAIASYLSPMTTPELLDLSNKFIAPVYKRRDGFFKDLKDQGTLLLAAQSMQPLKQEDDSEKNTKTADTLKRKRSPS